MDRKEEIQKIVEAIKLSEISPKGFSPSPVKESAINFSYTVSGTTDDTVYFKNTDSFQVWLGNLVDH